MGTRGGAAATTAATTEQSSSSSSSSRERVRLKVLYDFEYETRGKRVRIVKDERLLLLRKTNDDWWQVVRPADVCGSLFVPEQSTFYVPTGYVVELQEDELLPETTRFYVDKDKMFKSEATGKQGAAAAAAASTGQEKEKAQEPSGKQEEPRKAHDSFRSVMRKLSGNLGATSDSNKAPKPAKPSKIIKSLRKTSVDYGEDAKLPPSKGSLVPAKTKDTWESSAFGMCFGRDMKNTDAQMLNPFQEELENALSNRVTHKKNILDNKLAVGNKPVDQACDDREKSPRFEHIQDKWVKASQHALKPVKPDSFPKHDNFQFVPLSKIKEDAQKRRSASPNFSKSDMTNNTVNSGAKRLSETEKLYSVVDKSPKKSTQLPDQKPDISSKPVDTPLPATNEKLVSQTKDKAVAQIGEKITPQTNQKVVSHVNEKVISQVNEKVISQMHDKVLSQTNENIVTQESPSKKDIDRLLINDKRKMWAIETLMSELMQSSSVTKTTASSQNNESGVSGPSQLAQELHEMNASRRFENAEIQVNLLDNKDDNTKENEKPNINETKVGSWKRKAFDFPPRPIKPPRSPTARSPKLLDEYNEANILNDNDRSREMQDTPVKVVDYNESPSYSNISMRIKREKVPCQLKMPTKDFREELQLTPSLEKLASEIKFLPASSNSMEFENEKQLLDMDCPTTTLSQDSLRLYKRRSKSDGALNRAGGGPRRRDSYADPRRNPSSASHMEISKHRDYQHHYHHQQQPHVLERKYAQHETSQSRTSLKAHDESAYYRTDRVSQATRYKLNRKSRSLGDLDCSELDEKQEDGGDTGTTSSYETESRRRYKPVPKLRSKESLRRVKMSTPTASSERLAAGKPVPAKRRVPPQPIAQPQQQQQQQPMCDSSYDDLSEIDIERSTAVGFKALLRTSDSGSEEYLQYKTFPATTRNNQLQAQQQQHQQQMSPYSSRSDGNVNNLSRSLSDEAILSSASCSSASPSRFLDGSVENLVNLPAGWTQTYDANAKRVCFINERGDKWFSSNDPEGKIYFFEENSNESSWALPPVVPENRVRTLSNGDWPQLFDGNMTILKEGLINKTKITTENGKKLRKTWSTSYAVLTELFLLFFKDAKTFAAMKMDQSAAAKPDISVDLNGAFIEPAEKLSNRKNVYLINTLLGLQVLIQWDNALVIAEWYREIHDAIQRLPFSQEYGRSSSSRE